MTYSMAIGKLAFDAKPDIIECPVCGHDLRDNGMVLCERDTEYTDVQLDMPEDLDAAAEAAGFSAWKFYLTDNAIPRIAWVESAGEVVAELTPRNRRGLFGGWMITRRVSVPEVIAAIAEHGWQWESWVPERFK